MLASSFLLTMQHGGGGSQTIEKQLCKELGPIIKNIIEHHQEVPIQTECGCRDITSKVLLINYCVSWITREITN